MEKYQRFMPGADERIVAMMEKEQEHRHRLENTQMETRSCIMIFKMMILIICPVVFFLSLFFVFIRGRLRKDSV